MPLQLALFFLNPGLPHFKILSDLLSKMTSSNHNYKIKFEWKKTDNLKT